ncbi:hypothetical protein SPRG_00919 [Saprolegnia parasitica CBS 223.65]|uniref:Uncharacterized protein n=1 Tax=Saprolegnia parasitica (strain CBS 223.65) TaxID=695850 RepID=A0A067CVX9_SAPPC|nr:hypothetical protein SPRG_00919 [Saprolegnia parasitica CBS 223.65]KDO34859.1 hypothetical protein SPRG_00919 [Saprolegnia parasitica CBS 223.65]|eukprot:XP_012194521.1 hypothetical protein SPRG_00919 [Saprolegnia parasitica CBS 223.65]
MAVSSMHNNPLYKYTLFHMKRRPSPFLSATTPFLEPPRMTTTSSSFLDRPARTGDASMAAIMYPTRSCMWIRGSPVCIRWSVLDDRIGSVRIELCQWGSSAMTTIATHAPNTGCFVYSKVPWGVIGHNFYIRITAAEHDDRFVVSEYFSIGNPRQGW